MFNGKIHYKLPFSIATLNYQRVRRMSWRIGRHRELYMSTSRVRPMASDGDIWEIEGYHITIGFMNA